MTNLLSNLARYIRNGMFWSNQQAGGKRPSGSPFHHFPHHSRSLLLPQEGLIAATPKEHTTAAKVYRYLGIIGAILFAFYRFYFGTPLPLHLAAGLGWSVLNLGATLLTFGSLRLAMEWQDDEEEVKRPLPKRK